MCYDGCFGLVRKFHGQSADIDDSLEENTFFVNQDAVDQFVTAHNIATKTGKKSSLKVKFLIRLVNFNIFNNLF